MKTRQEYIEILKNHADEQKANYGISGKHSNMRPFFLNQINKSILNYSSYGIIKRT